MECIMCGEELPDLEVADDPLGQWSICDNLMCPAYGYKQAVIEGDENVSNE